MKIRYILRFFFVCAFVVLFSCQRSAELIREKVLPLKGRNEVTFVIFGDSVSGGRGFSVTGTSYGSFLKPMMVDFFGSSVSMIHSCRAGETFKTAVRRIQEDIMSFRPDVVFIMLGLEDAMTRGLIMPIFKKQAGDFFKLLNERDTFVIVLTSPGFRDRKNSNDYRYKRLKEFNDIVVFSAAYHHYPVIDVCYHMEKLWKVDPKEYRGMFSDLVHFNEKGQKYIADFIMKSIADAVDVDER